MGNADATVNASSVERRDAGYSYSIYHHVDWIVKLSNDSGLEDLDWVKETISSP